MTAVQLDLIAALPVLDTARVAKIRAHARSQRVACSDNFADQAVADCWRAIENACRELDPTAVG